MKAALRLFLVRGLGLRSANTLIKHFKEPERVFEANSDDLEAVGIPPEIAEDILSPKSAERAEAEAEKAAKLGVTIIDILDPRCRRASAPHPRENFRAACRQNAGSA